MKRAVTLIAILVIPPVTTAVVSRIERYPHRFAEVIPGRLYRGGYPSAEHVERLCDDHGVRTIVNLSYRPDSAEAVAERTVARRAGAEVAAFSLPGDGCGDLATLEAAADAVARGLERGPVYLHCAAGKMRTNAVLAAYRLRYDGWSFDRTIAELEQYGLDASAEKDRALREHLRGLADGGRSSAAPRSRERN